MRRFAALVLASTLVLSAGNKKLDRLSEDELTHYYALQVWMDDKERKEYLKLKTQEERDQWLKEAGLWDRFYQYPDHIRDRIARGDIRVGDTHDRVLMAYGAPHNRKRVTGRNAQRSEALIYRFEVTPEGVPLIWKPGSKTAHRAIELFHIELIMDDGVVAERRKMDGWDE